MKIKAHWHCFHCLFSSRGARVSRWRQEAQARSRDGLLAEDLEYIPAAYGGLEPGLNHESTYWDFFCVGDLR
jgi:hypothetical protein